MEGKLVVVYEVEGQIWTIPITINTYLRWNYPIFRSTKDISFNPLQMIKRLLQNLKGFDTRLIERLQQFKMTTWKQK